MPGWLGSCSTLTEGLVYAQNGLYLIQYNAEVTTNNGNGPNATLRATLNASEISASRGYVTLPFLNEIASVSRSFIINVSPADVLALEFTGSGSGIRLAASGGVSLTVTRLQ